MSLYVVSDLHIRDAPTPDDDPLYRSLIAILTERAESGDTVVLAGDIFDLFVGNKPVFLERYREFLVAVRRCAERGASIHYIEGNHDFLLSKALGPVPGVHHHSHDVSLEIEGRKFFFAHGDTVDRGDYGYRALRAFFRSPLIRAFVTVAPGAWVDGIGKASSRRSQALAPRLPAELPTDRIERLRSTYRSYAAEKLAQGYDFVVLGHCHDLDEMSFTIGTRPGQYVNVGYPRVHGSFLSWSPGDPKIQRERLP